MCNHMYTTMCMWESEDNLQKTVPSFHPMAPSQVTRPGSRCLSTRHLSSPYVSINISCTSKQFLLVLLFCLQTVLAVDPRLH